MAEKEPNDEFIESYSVELNELVGTDKVTINKLTMLVEDNKSNAVLANTIAKTIMERLRQCPVSCKLPTLYLIDSVIKNVPQPYNDMFAPHLRELFAHAWSVADPSVKKSMKRLLATWEPIIDRSDYNQLEQLVDQSSSVLNDFQTSRPKNISGKPATVASLELQKQSVKPVSGVSFKTVTAGHPIGAVSVKNDIAAVQVIAPPSKQDPPAFFSPLVETGPTVHLAPVPFQTQGPVRHEAAVPSYTFEPSSHPPPPPPRRPSPAPIYAAAAPFLSAVTLQPIGTQQLVHSYPAVYPTGPLNLQQLPTPSIQPMLSMQGAQSALNQSQHLPVYCQPLTFPVLNARPAQSLGNQTQFPSATNLHPPRSVSLAQTRPATSEPAEPDTDAPPTTKFEGVNFKALNRRAVNELLECSALQRRKFLDLQFMRRKRLKNLTHSCRQWFVTADQWVDGTTIAADAPQPFLEVTIEEQPEAECSEPADESQPSCAISGERFEQYWDPDTQTWRYRDAKRLFGEEAERYGVPDGSLVIVKCLATCKAQPVVGGLDLVAMASSREAAADLMAAAADAIDDLAMNSDGPQRTATGTGQGVHVLGEKRHLVTNAEPESVVEHADEAGDEALDVDTSQVHCTTQEDVRNGHIAKRIKAM